MTDARDSAPEARAITVIQVRFLRGSGVKGDVVRQCFAYYDMDGNKLAERDGLDVKDGAHD